MLNIQNLSVSFGAIKAVRSISLSVEQGEIVALIGSNGAGKTTTLRTISHLEQAAGGSIQLMGHELTKIPPHKIVRLGIAHVPEGRRVFSSFSVADNLQMGAVLRKDFQQIKADYQRVYDLFPKLFERRTQMAGTLSGGEQQMLAVARALMTNGKLLLLDEPSMGLAPMIVDDIFRIIQTVRDEGITVLLVEQNAQAALEISDRAYVLETGSIKFSGASRELLNDNRIKEAYLGI